MLRCCLRVGQKTRSPPVRAHGEHLGGGVAPLAAAAVAVAAVAAVV